MNTQQEAEEEEAIIAIEDAAKRGYLREIVGVQASAWASLANDNADLKLAARLRDLAELCAERDEG